MKQRKKIQPPCARGYGHQLVPWDADSRFMTCAFGCGYIAQDGQAYSTRPPRRRRRQELPPDVEQKPLDAEPITIVAPPSPWAEWREKAARRTGGGHG